MGKLGCQIKWNRTESKRNLVTFGNTRFCPTHLTHCDGYVGRQVSTPVAQTVPSSTVVKSNKNFDVSLNKTQLNSLASFYLKKIQKDQKMKYKFSIKDQAILGGSTKVLGVNVNFALALKPVLLKNGNVRLDAKSLSVGSLRLPISFVMNYAAKNYKLPDWIALNSKKKTITMDLRHMGGNDSLSYKAKTITWRVTEGLPSSIPKSGKLEEFKLIKTFYEYLMTQRNLIVMNQWRSLPTMLLWSSLSKAGNLLDILQSI